MTDIKKHSEDGFIVKFSVIGKYLSTGLINFYENIFINSDDYWRATIFPLGMESQVKDRLDKSESWKDMGSYHFIYVTYKKEEEIVFSDKVANI